MFSLVLAATVAAQVTTISPGAVQAIGPKQDDPRAMCQGSLKGIIVQGGREAIGPKQDDPLKVATLARPGDDNDPKASGGGSGDKIVVQGGIEAIGPKQDDPRKLQIGPKQDDPRAPALGSVARPGDDNDPKAVQACEVQQR